MVTETFLLSALTIAAGLISGAIAMAYKSKCVKFHCWCIDIERDVKVEEKEDLAKLPETAQSES